MTAPNIQMQPGESGPAGSYAELKALFDQAVNFLHGRTRSGKKYTRDQVDEWVASTVGEGSPIRTFNQLVTSIQHLDRAGARPVEQSDLGPLERGAIARVVRFGHSALPFTDEIAGALEWLGGGSYREGRDVNRQYLENTELSTNRGPLDPQWWGAPAGALATMGAGSAAAAPSLLRAGATGAGFGLGYTAGELPELTPEAVGENAVPLALNTALGGVTGVGGAVVGRRLMALRQPGRVKMDRVLDAAGGEEGLARAVRESGVERPMLSELTETSFGRLPNALRLASQEAQTAAMRRLQGMIGEVRQAKAAVSQQYGILEAPITNPRAVQILMKPRLQKIVRVLAQDEVIQPRQPLTGRALEDIRQELEAQARRAYARKNPRVGKLLRRYSREIEAILDESFEGMPEVRAQYAPLAQREVRLLDQLRLLNRKAVAAGGLPPTQMRTTAKGELMQDLGSDPWQRQTLAARQMVEPLYTPGTAAEHLSRLRGGMPWYSRMGQASGGPGAALVPQLTDPFFPLRQLPDSGQ